MITMAAGVTGRFQAMLLEYGMVAFAVYMVIAVCVFTSAYVALGLGFEFDGAGAGVGRFAAAYVGLKLTQPFRLAATAILSPILARYAPDSWRTALQIGDSSGS